MIWAPSRATSLVKPASVCSVPSFHHSSGKWQGAAVWIELWLEIASCAVLSSGGAYVDSG